jgi:hypothetical protein
MFMQAYGGQTYALLRIIAAKGVGMWGVDAAEA